MRPDTVRQNGAGTNNCDLPVRCNLAFELNTIVSGSKAFECEKPDSDPHQYGLNLGVHGISCLRTSVGISMKFREILNREVSRNSAVSVCRIQVSCLAGLRSRNYFMPLRLRLPKSFGSGSGSGAETGSGSGSDYSLSLLS
jgi:hypothetical protein